MRIRQGVLSEKAILKTNVLNQEVPLNRPDLFIRSGNKLFRPQNFYDYVKCLKDADEYQQQGILLAYQERANKSVSLHVVPYKNNFRPPHQVPNLSAVGSTPLTVRVKVTKLSTETQTTPSLNNTETQTTQLITGEQGIQTENSGEPSNVPVQIQVAPEVAPEVEPEVAQLPQEQTIPTRRTTGAGSSIEDFDTPDYSTPDFSTDEESDPMQGYIPLEETYPSDEEQDVNLMESEVMDIKKDFTGYSGYVNKTIFSNFKNALLRTNLTTSEKDEILALFPNKIGTKMTRAQALKEIFDKAISFNKYSLVLHTYLNEVNKLIRVPTE